MRSYTMYRTRVQEKKKKMNPWLKDIFFVSAVMGIAHILTQMFLR